MHELQPCPFLYCSIRSGQCNDGQDPCALVLTTGGVGPATS